MYDYSFDSTEMMQMLMPRTKNQKSWLPWRTSTTVSRPWSNHLVIANSMPHALAETFSLITQTKNQVSTNYTPLCPPPFPLSLSTKSSPLSPLPSLLSFLAGLQEGFYIQYFYSNSLIEGWLELETNHVDCCTLCVLR